MKQNLFWGEEIVREFFVNFCFEKSSLVFTAPDEAQNTGGLFTVLNKFWATELADVLIPRDQVSVGDPLFRG